MLSPVGKQCICAVSVMQHGVQSEEGAHGKFRAVTLWVAVVQVALTLLSAAGPPKILCFGTDGHCEFEHAYANCCLHGEACLDSAGESTLAQYHACVDVLLSALLRSPNQVPSPDADCMEQLAVFPSAIDAGAKPFTFACEADVGFASHLSNSLPVLLC